MGKGQKSSKKKNKRKPSTNAASAAAGAASISEAEKFYQQGKTAAASKDFNVARQAYQRATDLGSQNAKYALAVMLRKGRGGPEDKPKALELLMQVADSGNVDAAFAIALMCEKGEGLSSPNLRRAEFWYRRALALPRAQYGLAQLLWKDGVNRKVNEKKEAVSLFYQAKEAGHKKAEEFFNRLSTSTDIENTEATEFQYILGLLYYEGGKIPENGTQALNYLKRSAGKKHVNACYTMGLLYHHGCAPISADIHEAEKWYEDAFKKYKHPAAACNLGGIRFSQEKYVEAYYFYKYAVEHGIKIAEKTCQELLTLFNRDDPQIQWVIQRLAAGERDHPATKGALQLLADFEKQQGSSSASFFPPPPSEPSSRHRTSKGKGAYPKSF